MLGISGYRRIVGAALVSRAGDAVNFVALPLYVLAASSSAPLVGSLVLAEGAGLIAGGGIAHLVVDRQPPRRLLVALDLARAGAAAGLALVPSVPGAIAVSFLLALATAVSSPVTGAIIPRLVDDGDLPAANALQWGAGVAPQLVAAAAGGLLVAVSSARVAFAVNAASFAASALILSRLPVLRPASVSRSSLSQLPEALRSVRHVAILPPLMVVQGLAALAAGASSALLVVLAEEQYGLGPVGYGLWLAVIGLGALVGPLAVPLLSRATPSRTMSGAYVVRGVGDIGLGMLRAGVAGGALLGVYALSTSSGMVAYQTLVQRSIRQELRGRVFALLDVIWHGGRLLSVAAGGVVAAVAGIRVVYVVGGALLVLAGLVGLRWLPAGGRRTAGAGSDDQVVREPRSRHREQTP